MIQRARRANAARNGAALLDRRHTEGSRGAGIAVPTVNLSPSYSAASRRSPCAAMPMRSNASRVSSCSVSVR